MTHYISQLSREFQVKKQAREKEWNDDDDDDVKQVTAAATMFWRVREKKSCFCTSFKK